MKISSYVSGFALNNDGREIASMGLAVGDYMNNGLVDLLVTDFSDDYKTLYHNDGDASFTEVGSEAGIAQIPVPFVGWGDGFLDYDNDGWKDIMMINGHVYPQVDEHDWGTTFAERALLFRNLHNGKFEYVPAGEGVGAGHADLRTWGCFWRPVQQRKDRCGNQSDRGAAGALEECESGPSSLGGTEAGGWRKESAGCCGRDGLFDANGIRQREDVMSGGSYISSNDQRPHFGIGDATDAGTAEIHWPSGVVQKVKLPGMDRIFTITEGKGITGVLCAKQPCLTKALRKVGNQKP